MILINGRETARVDVADRGFAYGDGVFETVAWHAGTPLKWAAHYARLQAGCARLDMLCPKSAVLYDEIGRVATAREKAVIKITVTRGEGGRGYRPVSALTPTRVVARHPWPDLPPAARDEGVWTWVCRHRLGSSRELAGLKHLNRLDQVLASSEWPGEAYAEGLMLDAGGYLIEGTRSNVFLVQNGVINTPALTYCGVNGIIREHILALCRAQARAHRIRAIDVGEIAQADEIFLTNSIIGVWPVCRVQHHQRLAKAAGPVTAALTAALRAEQAIL